MGLRARIASIFDIEVTGSGDLGIPTAQISKEVRQAFDTGTAINQATMAFGDDRTVNASATDSLDLAGGLSGALGGSLTFAAIKEIFVHASADNDGNLLVGEGVSNAFQGPFGASAVGVLVPPGGVLHLRNPTAAGWPVTASSGDILAVENAGSEAADYTIILIGETA